MDAAYCSPIIREHSQSLGHVPLTERSEGAARAAGVAAQRPNDHNPRRGEKVKFAPHQAERFKERTTVERVKARFKDDFGVSRVNVRGHAKVMAQMMFAVLALSADQLLRWVT